MRVVLRERARHPGIYADTYPHPCPGGLSPFVVVGRASARSTSGEHVALVSELDRGAAVAEGASPHSWERHLPKAAGRLPIPKWQRPLGRRIVRPLGVVRSPGAVLRRRRQRRGRVGPRGRSSDRAVNAPWRTEARSGVVDLLAGDCQAVAPDRRRALCWLSSDRDDAARTFAAPRLAGASPCAHCNLQHSSSQ